MRVYRHDGVAALAWEVLFQALKPFLRIYERCACDFCSITGKTCFSVFGNRITVLPGDRGLSRELAAYRIHEPLASTLLEQTLRPGMTVVDIGSNIGYYALMESRLVGSSGKVVAIEPVPQNATQLRDNVRSNGCDNIEIHQLAIGRQSGTQPVYLSGKSNHHSLLPTPSVPTVMVEVATLDDLVSASRLSSVQLIRMDLEGYEVEILDGMRQTLQQYGPRLLVELHPHIVGSTALLAYLETLQSLGYAPEWVFEQERDYPIRWKFIKPEYPTMNELLRDPRIVCDLRATTVLFAPERPAASTLETCVEQTPGCCSAAGHSRISL